MFLFSRCLLHQLVYRGDGFVDRCCDGAVVFLWHFGSWGLRLGGGIERASRFGLGRLDEYLPYDDDAADDHGDSVDDVDCGVEAPVMLGAET